MTADPSSATLQNRILELEEALRQQRAWWHHTVNAFSDWVCIIDLDFKIVASNRAVADFVGVRREEALGRRCYALVHGADAPIDGCPLPRMLESGRRAQTEVAMADGRWLAITADPLKDGAGRISGAVHMVRDISAHKAVQTEREALIRKLEQSLAEVKTLKGLIPICAGCRRIRDDSGAWSPLEEFVHNNFDADFSHGLCPECAQKEYKAFGL